MSGTVPDEARSPVIGVLTIPAVNLDSATTDPRALLALSDVFRLLSMYSYRKALAMLARLQGRIQAAIDEEHACEKLYKELPEWARW